MNADTKKYVDWCSYWKLWLCGNIAGADRDTLQWRSQSSNRTIGNHSLLIQHHGSNRIPKFVAVRIGHQLRFLVSPFAPSVHSFPGSSFREAPDPRMRFSTECFTKIIWSKSWPPKRHKSQLLCFTLKLSEAPHFNHDIPTAVTDSVSAAPHLVQFVSKRIYSWSDEPIMK